MLHNKVIYFATEHKKEQVIAPSFFDAFNCRVKSLYINSDILGTFSGDVERKLSPIQAAKEKIKMGLIQKPDAEYLIASEGSFYPDSQVPWMPVNEELLLFYDAKQEIEIVAKAVTREVKYVSKKIDSSNLSLELFNEFDFPNHGVVIVSKDKVNKKNVIKDVNDYLELDQLIKRLKEGRGMIQVMTDLRSHKNPTRQKNIYQAGLNLIDEIKLVCPNCQRYGQKIREHIEGLLCAQCGIPSKYIKSIERECSSCTKTWMQDLGKAPIDPMYCDWCNP